LEVPTSEPGDLSAVSPQEHNISGEVLTSRTQRQWMWMLGLVAFVMELVACRAVFFRRVSISKNSNHHHQQASALDRSCTYESEKAACVGQWLSKAPVNDSEGILAPVVANVATSDVGDVGEEKEEIFIAPENGNEDLVAMHNAVLSDEEKHVIGSSGPLLESVALSSLDALKMSENGAPDATIVSEQSNSSWNDELEEQISGILSTFLTNVENDHARESADVTDGPDTLHDAILNDQANDLIGSPGQLRENASSVIETLSPAKQEIVRQLENDACEASTSYEQCNCSLDVAGVSSVVVSADKGNLNAESVASQEQSSSSAPASGNLVLQNLPDFQVSKSLAPSTPWVPVTAKAKSRLARAGFAFTETGDEKAERSSDSTQDALVSASDGSKDALASVIHSLPTPARKGGKLPSRRVMQSNF
jgi:hypothetical protein